jgi:general secretion pathway protein C
MFRAAAWLVLAGLAGSTLSTAAAGRLLLSEQVLTEAKRTPDPLRPERPRSEPPRQVSSASESESRSSIILDHNVFCPGCRPAHAATSEAPPQLALAPTELPLVLLATMVAKDPLQSMASITDTQRAATGVFNVNEQLRAGVVVAEIRRGRVLLRTREGLRTLALPDPDAPKPKLQPPKKASPPKRGSREIAGARDAINCEGHDCTVDRRFVDQLMADPRQLSRQARLVPAVKDGAIRGFRLSRVRRGTLPRLLGLHNGDTLLAVNGTDLDSLDRAVGLYAKLRRASNLSVTVERKGKVFDKNISIR